MVLSRTVDVLIVGAGPSGLTLANILGQAGVDTWIVDRDVTTVDSPRAVSIDDEAVRVMQGLGIADVVLADLLPDYGTRYRSPWGSEFALVRPTTREFGFPRRSAFRQPDLEATLASALSRYQSVRLSFEHVLEGLQVAGAAGATAQVRHRDDVHEVTARYVVGADGASSTVRELLGITLRGTSFGQRWLVVDAEQDTDSSFDTIAYCDHRRPAISLPGPKATRRWELMLKDSERDETVLEPGWSDQALRQMGLQPPIHVARRAVYAFHARIADHWRRGPVFLIGDAAHLSPPYAGQGMNSGIRDAANLGWKLAAALRGILDDAALNSYEQERKPHAWSMIQLAVRIGSVMTPSTARRAYAQAAFFHAASAIPTIKRYLIEMRFKPKPVFEHGVLLADGVRESFVGKMLPQPLVGRGCGGPVLLDDVLGQGFALVRLDGEFPGYDHPLWRELGVSRTRVLASDRRPLPSDAWTEVRDEGGLHRRLRGYADRVLLVRPDRYVAGSFTDAEADGFASRLQTLLAGASVATEVSRAC